jgi:putative ABC transport system substrate-binding protein
MTRREVLALLAAAMATATAVAQQPERPRVIGVLIHLSENDPDNPPRVAGFQWGLQELGWFEGRNVRIHYRFTADFDRLQVFAKELVGLQPDVIVASSTPVVVALQRETRTIPIVFVTASDPVGNRFVEGLARPGGNATGFTNNLATMGGKWLELLKEIAPATRQVAVMYNAFTAPAGRSYYLPPMEAAAASFDVTTVAMPVRNAVDIENVLASHGRELGGALIVLPDSFTTINRQEIIAKAARYHVPAIYPSRSFVIDGGLMSYGADLHDLYRRVPTYVDRILKGARPAELPVQQPAKVDFVVNLKTARSLGLTVPRIMLARADEVVE